MELNGFCIDSLRMFVVLPHSVTQVAALACISIYVFSLQLATRQRWCHQLRWRCWSSNCFCQKEYENTFFLFPSFLQSCICVPNNDCHSPTGMEINGSKAQTGTVVSTFDRLMYVDGSVRRGKVMKSVLWRSDVGCFFIQSLGALVQQCACKRGCTHAYVHMYRWNTRLVERRVFGSRSRRIRPQR